MIKKIEIERFSLTSSKPFDQVVAALNAAIGHPDMAALARMRSYEGKKITSPSRGFEV